MNFSDLLLLVVNLYLEITKWIGYTKERVKRITIMIVGWIGTWISYGKDNSKKNQGYLILSGTLQEAKLDILLIMHSVIVSQGASRELA